VKKDENDDMAPRRKREVVWIKRGGDRESARKKSEQSLTVLIATTRFRERYSIVKPLIRTLPYFIIGYEQNSRCLV
jgi:hypothetical protein